MRRTIEIVAVLGLALLAPTGCRSGSYSNDPDASDCAVTEIVVAPETATVGETVTITGTPSGCKPDRDYELTLTDGNYGHPITITATADADGGFSTNVTVPADFPVGPASVVLVAPYPPCNDTGNSAGLLLPVASCAAVQTLFDVQAAP